MPQTSQATFRERQRALLIDITETLIATEGLAAVQARRVAKDAGCAVGTVYNIFGDIDGLILAVNERTLHALGSALAELAAGAGASDLRSRLMGLAMGYLSFATSHPRRWRAVFEHRLPDGTVVPAFYVEDRQQLLALIEAQLASAVADEKARGIAAHALFSAVHGIVLLSLDEKLGAFDAELCRQQISFIVENVARALE
jgi:AcrR family transcriptional regulator